VTIADQPVPRTNGPTSIDYASWGCQTPQASWLSAICLNHHSYRKKADRWIRVPLKRAANLVKGCQFGAPN